MKGKALVQRLSEMEMNQDYLHWKVARTEKRNTEVTLSGIVIGPKLNNYIIGKALSIEANLIIVSNGGVSIYEYEPYVELLEYIYKENLFILEWDIRWAYSTNSGLSVLRRIFDSKKCVRVMDNILEFTYENEMHLTSVLSRIKCFTLFSQREIKKENITSKQYQLLFQGSYPSDIECQTDYIITTHFLENLELLLLKGKVVIFIQDTLLINEISREMYYVLKPGNNIAVEIDFQNGYCVQ